MYSSSSTLCLHKGQEKELVVTERDIPEEEEEKVEDKEEGNEKGEVEKKLETPEEEVTIFKPKMKEFPGTAEVIGLRIRAEPSFLVSPSICRPTKPSSFSLPLPLSPFFHLSG